MQAGRIRSLTAAMVVLAITGTRAAFGVPIGPGDFGPGAVFESFEGLSPGPNIPAVGNGAFLRPGENTAYTFPSGASLTFPIPNPAVHGVRVGDFALGDATSHLQFGDLTASHVPFGTAYLIGGEETSDSPRIEFSFAADVLRVGAYITGSHTWYVLSAYDATGTLIGSVQRNGGAWNASFLGIQDQRGIRRVAIGGCVVDTMVATRNTLVDGLTFELLPEPSTGSLLLVAVALAHLKRRSPRTGRRGIRT